MTDTTDDAPVVHRRTIEIEARDEGDDLAITCRLRDERPYTEFESRRFVHDMELRVRVRQRDLTITASSATMHRYPHIECADIEGAFADLVGLRVGRGFTRAVKERLGGPNGCAHLTHLAGLVGPAVIQASTSARNRRSSELDVDVRALAHLRNTCHLWADAGPGEQKVALGWRPRMDDPEYPFPSVEELRRRGSS
ncbi:MAG: DUF2889 domain-containing protein [Acidimicrobiia bacterium]